jgi:Amt family ammonium transporter
MWVLIGAALVFFMQAGFAMVEAGFTRAKNSGNIIIKNLMNFGIVTPVFWFVGFGIMYGSVNSFYGGFDFFIHGNYSGILPAGIPIWAFVIFQTMFCATAATIVSGAMAERTKLLSFAIYCVIISFIVYPVAGHWIWGNGWLQKLGFHDFAGSTAVHMLGGIAALVGAKLIGPRIGKYSDNGKPKAILGHSITLSALGLFILWFCWFGFNSGLSVTKENGLEVAGRIFMTTNLSAAMSACTTLIFTWIRYKKPDVSMTLNGALAGLVAITAGCDAVTPAGAAIIGICSGILVVLVIEFIDRVLKIDDPVGVIGVHAGCGALGTIMVGLLAQDGGLFYNGGFKLLGMQIVGVLSVAIWVTIVMYVTFKLIDRTIGLRVTTREEIEGLDSTEHGLTNAYAEFLPATPAESLVNSSNQILGAGAKKLDVPIDEAIPVKSVADKSTVPVNSIITKVDIIAKQSKFEELKAAMNSIGVTGMTVTQVLGCGTQKGATEYYRGVPVDMILLPKVRVEIVVAKVPVEDVVNTARKVLYTGHIGDGKIFIYDVRDAVKVRTGETGYDAMQGVEDISS